MNRKTLTILLVFVAVACLGASAFAALHWLGVGEAQATPVTIDRPSSIADPHAEPADRADARPGPSDDRLACTDSDATLGPDAIFVRGTMTLGNGQKIDHCRLGQLVEMICLENPPGSGRLIDHYEMVDCPAGTRCISGECVGVVAVTEPGANDELEKPIGH